MKMIAITIIHQAMKINSVTTIVRIAVIHRKASTKIET